MGRNNRKLAFWLVCTAGVLFFVVYFLFLRKPPFRVGVLVNLSGAGGKAQSYIRDGVIFQIDRMKRLGCEFNLLPVVADYGGSDDKLKSALDKLYSQGVWLVVGPVTSHSSVVALNYVERTRKKIVFVSPYTATTKLSGRKDSFIRTCVDNRVFAKALLRWMEIKGFNRIFVVVDMINPDFTMDIYLQLKKLSLSKKISLKAYMFNSGSRFDPYSISREALGFSSDVVLLLARSRESAFITQALRLLGYEGEIVGTIWNQTPDYIKWSGKFGEGAKILTFIKPSYDNEDYRRVALEFYNKMGYRLNAKAIRAVEATQILCKTLKVLVSSGNEVTYENFLDSVVDRKFSTVMDGLYIDSYGDAKRPVYLLKVELGRFVVERVLLNEH